MSGICHIVGASLESIGTIEFDKNKDIIIACDGGLKFLVENNYPIDLVIGDFDSLNYIPKEYDPIILPKEKDVTDTHAGIIEGIKKGYKDFYFYGVTGGRIDHSIAMIQELYNLKRKGLNGTVFTLKQRLFIIHNEEFEIYQNKGYISIFAVGKAKGVTIKNLKYEIENKDLNDYFPLGVSNEFINKKATISVSDGYLLIVY